VDISYATSDGYQIAYRVAGDGPVDIVMVPGFVSHLEVAREEPLFAGFLDQLGSFCRLIQFDKRGMGLSDRLGPDETPSLDERVADIVAVMDAAGSKRAAMFAWSEGGPASIRFATAHPDRTVGLILDGTTSRFTETEGYAGIPRDMMETWIDAMSNEWGTGVGLWAFAPTMVEDKRLLEWWSRYQRFGATPRAVAASLRMYLEVDVRDDLPKVDAPALVLHVLEDILVPLYHAHYMAQRIPNAKLVELPGSDHMFWITNPDQVVDEIRTFLASTEDGAAIAEMRGPAKATTGWSSLTRAERRVADLVAEGLSNAEIATRLFVTRNTVETHVKHVFRKVGVSSRTELAARRRA
jgi:pimeloyl-ACP methyl ester carboxylesterase/DNA-binding CsgD family transcriptional regulator